MALSIQTLRQADGPQLIIKAFKESLSDKAEGELWSHVQNYVFGGQRTRGMTMAEYLVQEGVLHEKAVKGLRTISAKSSTTPNSAPSGSRTTMTADAAPDDDEEDEDITTVFPEAFRAFLLLEKSSLSGPLRITILIQCSYQYTIRAIGNVATPCVPRSPRVTYVAWIGQRAKRSFDLSGSPGALTASEPTPFLNQSHSTGKI